MLTTSKLLIDQDCPMCSLYGYCFVKTKLVSKNTIAPYQKFDKKNINIDFHKAKNKIALYNEQSQLTLYGIDALIHIVTHNRIRFNKILKSPIIYFIISQLYNFISYNRKIIFPVKTHSTDEDCTPDFRKNYRISYLITTAIITGFTLQAFSTLINNYLGVASIPYFEYYVAATQVFWQGLFLFILYKKVDYNYLGNMSTVSLIGSLLISIALLINYFVALPSIILLIYFGIVVSIMLVEHMRRVSILELPPFVTISWIIFRLFILLILFL